MLCDTTANRSLIETKNTNAFSAWLRVIWTTRKNKNNNNTALILCEFTYAHFPGKIYLLALFSFGFDFVTDTHNTSNVINISFGYKQCSQTVYYDYLIYETMTWSCNNENFWAKLSKTQFEQRMHHENYIDKWISCCLRRFFSI